ncbi:8-oxo-dGTP pyrophosphatase MutT (NUDIX family) [Actinomadura coerulea]|uniref:8-oxo-dGTP pyrophosphatase MutT (NUDIX family) n=1 Tax=Actinomadura coerulea TaxID=46159 RepID=A0A7X0G011_9ACTN|nr:8-oxo-dGTP pyrophosphatase MutT (NUDIX family) [Actinomadura coerulea]GGP95259.1 DNA mismatch repair protein MutT [Actinomadura coerulea]
MTAPADEVYRRRSARVLLVDDTDRVLLFRWPKAAGDPEAGHCWITPGGGVEEGETLSVAAARELREETGLIVSPEELGPQVAVASGYADLGWARGVFRDDFFLFRTPARDIDTAGFTLMEREHVSAHRWWRIEEMESVEEPIYPLMLAELLTELLAGRTPSEPVRLPWHH